MMPLQPGSVFAKAYEIVRPISAGGMGVVYEVIHLGTRRHRALKVMLAHIVADPKMRERFSLEAIVSADVESEHITEIFDAGIDPETDSPFLVMELLRGEDLGARVKRGERFSADETLVLMEQVARALEKTHAHGIVHRDLKPDNLFVTYRDDGSPRIKILDFGIAKIIKNDLSGPQATTKSFGTPFYMAREQITGESSLIGPPSDLYAVAQIVFTLLTGSPYFLEEAKTSQGNILTVLMAVGSQGTREPASVRALRRGVELPKAFDAWFARATALAASDRFASAVTMVDALRAALREPVRVVGDNSLRPTTGQSAPVQANASGGVAALSQSSRNDGNGPVAAESVRTQPEPFHETGSAQSITANLPKLPQKRSSRTALGIGIAALLGCSAGVAAWQISLRHGADPPQGGVSAQASDVSNEPVSTKPSSDLGNARGPSVSASSSAVLAVEPAAPSASAMSSGGVVGDATSPPNARPKPPRPKPTAGEPTPPRTGEVWETR